MAEQDRERRREEEAGQKGGAAEAFMGGIALPQAAEVVIPIGRVQWGPVFSGLVVAVGISVVLSALGVALGFSLGPPPRAGGLPYWMIGSQVVGLFIGAMLAARQSRVSHMFTGVVTGAVVWSLFLIADLVFGLTGFFSQMTAVTRPFVATARTMTANLGWWIFIGYIILLISAILGGASGVTPEEEVHEVHTAHT